MPSRTRRIATSLALLALVTLGARTAGAQGAEPLNVDSLTTALDATEVKDRAMAVAALSTLPPASLPITTRSKLVALLDREAATPIVETRADDGEDGAAGLYLMSLVGAVVKLGEPTSVRGLALVGLGMSAEVQRFVASRGDASVALLEEVERADTANLYVVAETRGRMLGDYATLLSASSRSTLRAELLHVATVNELAFARSARFAHLVEATPLLAQLASTATDNLSRAVLTRASAQLGTQRAQASVESIIQGLSASISALCLHAQGTRIQTCQSMVAMLTSAFDNLRASKPALAHDILLALAKAADDATRRGIITTIEGTMISGTATYLATRI
jgi:hypothetical protein